MEVVEHIGVAIFADDALIKYEKLEDKGKSIVKKENDIYKKIVRNKMMGLELIKRENNKKYDKLLTSICDQNHFNIDIYPKTLHDAYKFMENHSSTKCVKIHDGGTKFG